MIWSDKTKEAVADAIFKVTIDQSSCETPAQAALAAVAESDEWKAKDQEINCLKSQVDFLDEEIKRLKQPSSRGQENGQDFDYVRVREWAKSSPRKPANQSFTEGIERNVAYLIEELQPRMSEDDVTLSAAFHSLKGYLENLDTDKAAMTVLKTYTDRLHSHYIPQLEKALLARWGK